jgi:hypothetical protein
MVDPSNLQETLVLATTEWSKRTKLTMTKKRERQTKDDPPEQQPNELVPTKKYFLR